DGVARLVALGIGFIILPTGEAGAVHCSQRVLRIEIDHIPVACLKIGEKIIRLATACAEPFGVIRFQERASRSGSVVELRSPGCKGEKGARRGLATRMVCPGCEG